MGDVAVLCELLRDPRQVAALREPEWTTLVATARAANLLGALAERVQEVGAPVPRAVARHLDGARQLGDRQRQSVVWEVHGLQALLAPLGIPIVLLKGAAYVMACPHIARGRLFGDIDILVPREALGDVESRLMLGAWAGAKANAYDQRYYRRWMHELPPMVHVHRGTVLDVHHTILPLTARNAPDPRAIIDRALPVPGLPAIHVPCPEDVVAHSLTHLMHDGELHNGLRDLNDVDRLVRVFALQPGFWERLAAVVKGNDLVGPIDLGLRLLQRLFRTSIPSEFFTDLGPHRKPGWRSDRWLQLYETALLSSPGGAGDRRARLARQAIYLRAHRLRMPLPMLAGHLAVKSWMRLTTGRAG